MVGILHPGSLTWPLKNDGWKTTFLLGWYIFRGYVKLAGGSFLLGPGLFSGAFAVSVREGIDYRSNPQPVGKVLF